MTTRRWKKPTGHPIFTLPCGLRKPMVMPPKAEIPGRCQQRIFSYLGVPSEAGIQLRRREMLNRQSPNQELSPH